MGSLERMCDYGYQRQETYPLNEARIFTWMQSLSPHMFALLVEVDGPLPWKESSAPSADFFYFCFSESYVKNRLLVTFAGLDTQDQPPFPYCSVMNCCGDGQVFQSLGIQKRPFALSKGKASLDVQIENRQAMRILLMAIVNIPHSKKFLRGSQCQSVEPRTVCRR